MDSRSPLASLVVSASPVFDMRLLWLSPLLLASICLSSTPEDQPSCGVFSDGQGSGCSLEPTSLRVANAEQDAPESSRATRSVKHKHHAKSHKRSRIARSTQEEIEISEDDDSPQEHRPRPVYSEEQMSLQVQGNLRNLMKQLQASSFLPAPRYCPHCRQLLPPEQAFLHQPMDPRMFLPVPQLPRLQAIPMKMPSSVSDETKDFPNFDDAKPRPFVPEEFCPLNYRMTTEEDEEQSQAPPDLHNQTSPNPIKYKEFKKAPSGFSETDTYYVDHESYDEMSPNPSFNKMEMVSFLKQSKLPAIEEITKYLEKKKNT